MSKNLYTRAGIFWARFKVKGVTYRESLRTRSLAVAERRLKAVRQEIEDRAYYGAREAVSWEAGVVGWNDALPRLGLKPDTIKRYLTSLGQVREWLDGVDVQKIDTALIKVIIRDRSKRGATNATIRRDLTAIASVLSVAVDEGWIEENPARMIDRGRVKEKREPIYLPEHDSLAAVFALASRFTDLAEFALETGMRQNEVVTLRHSQIDRARMAVMLTETKTNRVRSVPLSAKALAIIDRQPQYLRSPNVFWRGAGEAFKNVGAQFYATVGRVTQKAAQEGVTLRPFRFHDARHLFAVTFLRERRGGIYDLQQILGHASIKTTEMYLAYLTPDERREAIQGVAQSGAQDQRLEATGGDNNG